MKLLIIEDDPTIRNELAYFLKAYGYLVDTITHFEGIMDQVFTLDPHLILLDLQLPGIDGHTLCRQIRKQSQVPIIIVTSKNTEMDELMSINLGADDFITKPYNMQILLARIESLLKRSYAATQSTQLTYEGLKLDIAQGLVSFENNEQTLTKNELKILHHLIQNQGTIISRENLMEYLWSSDLFVDDNTLSVNMTRLRKKLEAMGMENPIETRRGMGYIMP